MSSRPVIAIVMAVHNGADFLSEQIASFQTQTLAPDILIISDDASTDSSKSAVHDAVAGWDSCKVWLLDGPAKGYGANFAYLISETPENADFVALSDQDDVWLPDKLAHATDKLSNCPLQTPCLYASATWVCDANLRRLHISRHPGITPNFRHAIAQNVLGGNTMVLNRSAVQLVCEVLQTTTPGPVHDWWLYQLITGIGGKVLYDHHPTVLYRQHDQNEIGANRGFNAASNRVKDMLNGRYKYWNDANLASLLSIKPSLTKEAQTLAEQVEDLRHRSLLRRISGLAKTGIHRDGLIGQIGLWTSIALGKF